MSIRVADIARFSIASCLILSLREEARLNSEATGSDSPRYFAVSSATIVSGSEFNASTRANGSFTSAHGVMLSSVNAPSVSCGSCARAVGLKIVCTIFARLSVLRNGHRRAATSIVSLGVARDRIFATTSGS